MELDSMPEELKQHMEHIGSTGLVIGLPASSVERTAGAIEAIRSSVTAGQFPSITLVIPPESIGEGALPLETPSTTESPIRIVPLPMATGRLPALADRLSDVYRAIFAIGKKLEARACAVVGSDLEAFNFEWIRRLVQPVLDRNFDLVMPSYSRHRFDGLLTSSILYPLTGALYGKRVRWPLALDIGLSARMMDVLLTADPPSVAASRRGPPTWMTTAAVSSDLTVCEAQLGIRAPAGREPGDLSSTISYILGPLFLDMEFRVTQWQQVRGSKPVPVFGGIPRDLDEAEPVDVRPMVEAFQLAFGNLQEVWGLVLPPATLLELKKLTRQPIEQFRLADIWWARIIYDFALAHRLRVINRDQLLRALTPLYRAWLASYALEAQRLNGPEVERRLEKLCMAYESEKSYLVSRWRWPDRFSP